ncbi:FAD-dependent oxidoreductase [Mycolicibacterium arenosum]|uniref:FAD-dependent oxidoreductase n=1 Tax=Mycolicibacterium arenosum TaxID=2952157 RepID=UPI0026E53E92|nr:FAD-dependent oxidoreductase [Mycolicibacterium sp. CAU 1645]
MSPGVDVQVIVVGAGPVGLSAAVELRRRGVDVLIVDKRDGVAPWAKAVGIQPRTLEIWDQVGVIERALSASQSMLGQVMYVNGQQVGEVRFDVPEQVPYGFISLPQYATEEILGAHLADLGTSVHRGLELVAVRQDDDGVTATLRDADGQREVNAEYLVAAEGAHSLVRRSLGLTFDGDAFPEEYMLADVELDWSVQPGMSVRSSHVTDGVVDDVLVCIPLPGRCRYRISMLVPEELSAAADDRDGVAHGLSSEGPKPELRHVQAVLDRLAPEPTTASAMRWSSVFRISHRLVNRYQQGRVFLAGDSAHIHPPTGAQGMNTGVQDAYNLGWKLALAVRGEAAPGLLDSYHAERHPVGEEVVGRTVRAAREGIGAGDDLQTAVLRTAQLLVHYADSPIVAGDAGGAGPIPGERAPDATGLRRSAVTGPLRFHETLRHTGHTLLLWATTEQLWRRAQDVAAQVSAATRGHVHAVIAVPASLEVAAVAGDTLRDGHGNLSAAYGFGDPVDSPQAVLIRPDGYLSYRSATADATRLLAHLAATTLRL